LSYNKITGISTIADAAFFHGRIKTDQGHSHTTTLQSRARELPGKMCG